MSAPAGTDRGAWKLVARRDFWVRARERGFIVSTGITVLVLAILISLRALSGDARPAYDLGLLGDSAAVGELTVGIGDAFGVRVRAVRVDDQDEAEEALRSGLIDAVLVDGERLISRAGTPGNLERAVSFGLFLHRLREALAVEGSTPEDTVAILTQGLPEVALERPDPNRDARTGAAIIAALMLWGQIFGYGLWVANGVIEEKSSRVVELLLSAIRPRQLLAGKILGIGALGLAQLALIASVAVILATALGVVALPTYALGMLAVVLGWFVLGFAFYASVFAVAGSLVSRVDDLQNAVVPINLTMLGSLAISIISTRNPELLVARLGALLPISSPLAMPVRIALGAASAVEIAVSVTILVASIAGMVAVAARMYERAVLRIGARLRVREVWRAAA